MWVQKMKSIKNVKLGLNSDMTVIVNADVEMVNAQDQDDLYLVMFNIMDDPLRLSLFTIGQLINLVKRNTELSETQAYAILEENPEKYIQMAVQDMEVLGTYGVENVKIPLNSKENAQKARLVLTSMVNNQHYLQKSKYFINGETIEKEQKVDTIPLIPQLKMMLEIVKRWDGFDSLKFKEEIESGKIKL